MALPARRTPARALTASATRLRSRTQTAYSQRLTMPWQLRALSYYDQIGEIRYAAQFYAKQLAQVRFYPARLLEDGNTEPIESGLPVELLDRVQDPAGGRSRLQYDYGRLMFITGEGLLFADHLDTDYERWRFLWKDEVKVLEDGRAVRLDYNKQETGDVGVAYRMWNPHPRHSDEADSPIRPVMEIAEELLVLTASIMGTATTRLTNGFLYIATEFSPNPPEPLGDEDPENNIFLQDLAQHIQSQIENPGAPESKVPPIIEGSFDYSVGGIQHIKVHDPANDYMEQALRTECIKRLAMGLDMPPEALLGMTDANHWTAKQVEYDKIAHVRPVAQRFADDLNEAYLKKALELEGYEDFNHVVIGVDDAKVGISPDRTQDANSAADHGYINELGYMNLMGIPNEHKATEEDKRIYLAIKLRNPALLKGTKYEVDPEDMVPAGVPGPDPSANGDGPAEDGPPEPTRGRAGSREEAMRASGEIMGAARMALIRCRGQAGARLRRHQQSCKDCQEKTDRKPNAQVASILGPEQVMSLVPDHASLVANGASDFRSYLEESGISSEQAAALAQRIEVYAAHTLFEPNPELPPGFAAAVVQAEEVSGALVHP